MRNIHRKQLHYADLQNAMIDASGMLKGLAPTVAAHVGRRPFHALATAYLARPFSGRKTTRLCIYHEKDPISMAQIYPFLYYSSGIAAEYDAEIRCFPITDLLDDKQTRQHRPGDTVLVQAWFTRDGKVLSRAIERLKAQGVMVSFVDAFAHNDLRLARHLDPHVDFYFKKSLFRDRSLYFRAFQGDTNLSEYYQQLYGLPGEPVDWKVPEGFTSRLRLSPGFFTSPHLITAFRKPYGLEIGRRTIDLHARLGLGPNDGSWYRRMREDALARVKGLTGLNVVSDGSVSHKQYMRELFNAKLCFSPFGYGELCWRDIESILAGAVLVKPDMGHLELLPGIFEPGVTYLQVRWDFADVAEVVRAAVANQHLLSSIAVEAHRRVRTYLGEGHFVNSMNSILCLNLDDPISMC